MLGLLVLLLLCHLGDEILRTTAPTHGLRARWDLDGRGLQRGEWWTPLTYALLHFNHWHLVLNLGALALFGHALSERFSWGGLAVLTFASGLGRAGLWLAFHHGQRGAVIGASAIVCGYLAAFALDRPRALLPLLGTRLGFPR